MNATLQILQLKSMLCRVFVRSIDWNQFSLWPSFGMVLFTVFNGLALTRLNSIYFPNRSLCAAANMHKTLNCVGRCYIDTIIYINLIFIYALVIKLSGARLFLVNHPFSHRCVFYTHTQINCTLEMFYVNRSDCCFS